MNKSLALLVAAAIAIGGYAIAGATANATDATIYKNPNCQCCEGYADYLRQNGFKVTVKPTHELSAMSRKAGIPDNFQGCHLAFIDRYVVSGHVTIKTVRKLLTEKPDIKGVTLPGMPMGSPGMNGRKNETWTTYSIGEGAPKVYAKE